MMRDRVAPALRELGFQGSGQAFTLPAPDHFVILGFQKSANSDRSEVSFTINVSAVSKAAWRRMCDERTYLPETPSPNTYYCDDAWQQRIGALMPRSDREPWWTVRAGESAESVADEVLNVVRDYAVPAIEDQLGPY